MTDAEAYKLYPQHRKWFNKLWVSEMLKYRCGPAGIAPDITDLYVIRPIYNLAGMGATARITRLAAGDHTTVPPGYFWCEVFKGVHTSTTYKFHHDKLPYWEPLTSWQGIRDDNNPLYRFTEWKRLDPIESPSLPRSLNVLSDIPVINVEHIDGKIIEVHLRDTPDPQYDHIIPLWKDEDKSCPPGYKFIESYEDGDGYLPIPRLGFFVK